MLLQKINNLENTNKEILNKLNSTETRTTTNFQEPLPTIGPRLQKINPETLQLIKVYETVTECMKEDSAIKRPSIHKAVEENLVYKGFRWMYIDRELDPNILYNIQPNKKSKSQNLGYIAKLNATKLLSPLSETPPTPPPVLIIAVPLAYLVPKPEAELHAHACGYDIGGWLEVIIASIASVQVNPPGVPVGLKRLDGLAYRVPYPDADQGQTYK
jgi:hypothetical protein